MPSSPSDSSYVIMHQGSGRGWTQIEAIDGDLERACDRSGRQLPAHWYEEPVRRGEPAWRMSRRAIRGGSVFVNDQPWTYHREAYGDAWERTPDP